MTLSTAIKGARLKINKETRTIIQLGSYKIISCYTRQWDIILGMLFLSAYQAIISIRKNPLVYLSSLQYYMEIIQPDEKIGSYSLS